MSAQMSFGWTHLSLQTNSGTIKADLLTITVTWLLGDTTFSQPKDLPMPPPLCVQQL